MPVITIRGQHGSGAAEIGEMIARQLNIDYVDREIIARVAEHLRQPSESIADKETPPTTLLGRIAEAISWTSCLGDGIYAGVYLPLCDIPLDDGHYLEGLDYVIKELAKNRSIVILGRGSQCILKEMPGVFHVLIVAPLEARVKRVMENLEISEEEARKKISRFDEGSSEFVRRYFQADVADPINYDLVINTGHLSKEDAASIIVKAVLLAEAQH